MRRIAAALTALTASVACTAADTGTDTVSSLGSTSSAYAPSDAERVEIVAALQTVFDALRTGDSELLRGVMDPNAVMHSSETDASGATSHASSTLESLATRIQSSDVPLIERMWNPVVRVDGALASIWTPYDFYSGSTFSHCGVDTATLVERDDGWKVVALSWTRAQPPACPLHPEGPPPE